MKTRYEKAKVVYDLGAFPPYILDYPLLSLDLKSRVRGTTWTYRWTQVNRRLVLEIGPGYLVQLGEDRGTEKGKASISRYAARRIKVLRDALVKDMAALCVWVVHTQDMPDLNKMYRVDHQKDQADLSFLRTLAKAEIRLLKRYRNSK